MSQHHNRRARQVRAKCLNIIHTVRNDPVEVKQNHVGWLFPALFERQLDTLGDGNRFKIMTVPERFSQRLTQGLVARNDHYLQQRCVHIGLLEAD
jgi:hypothetical protein